MTRWFLLIPAAPALFCTMSMAQTERQHQAHVHGTSQMEIAVDAEAVHVNLRMPGMDLVGFEHAPGSQADRATLAQALASLRSTQRWLGFEPQDTCEVSRIDIVTSGYGETSSDAEGSHTSSVSDTSERPHGDDFHHHEDHHLAAHGTDTGSGHSEFVLNLEARCTEAPDALQVRLAVLFPGIGTVRVDLITDAGQSRVDLSGSATRVTLQ